ncbi:MAG: putative porin [Bacteroidaceae bacterium]|nr:putative porin [Bacteroidaceae bacterium]
MTSHKKQYKTRRAAVLLLALLSPLAIHAQRIIGELESNSDGDMMFGNDTTDLDSNGKKKKKTVPVDVRAWTIDEIFGDRTPTDVDTLHHQYQNNDLTEGLNGHYNHLGNLGSPRLSRIFMERDEQPQFIFTYPLDQFLKPTSDFRFYNTKSPFMNLAYNFCGSKETGDDHFKAIYTNNVNKLFNFGGIFDYMYGQGYYANQSTSLMNATAFASYTGDKYNLHFYYMHNYIKMAENGGIEDEMYITRPEDLSQSYATNDIPTMLNQTWNRQEHDIIFLNHKYNIGFTRTEGDSTDMHEVFVPVTSIFHSLKIQKYARRYTAYETPEHYHSYMYLPGDSADDRTRNFSVKTIAGLSLCEGFNKWAAAGLDAYAGVEYNRFTLPDTIPDAGFGTLTKGRQTKLKEAETNLLVGGRLSKAQGKSLHYNVDAEFVVAGADAGDFTLNGHGELNMPLFKDTVQLAVNAYLKNVTPGYYYGTFHSKHAWWDIDVAQETRTRIEGELTIPQTHTQVKVGIENIKNYTYFANNGTPYVEDGITKYSNNVAPMQCGENIQVISANLLQNFKLGIFHLDNDVTFQTCSNKDVLPLPTLSLYHNLYITFKIAKVLSCELGGDVKYFTEYYAPDYSPVIGQFCLQNPNNKVKIGNYPLVSVYANFDLKRTRFYIQYYHANQGSGRYFWAPRYPMNPAGVHFGLSWNFYD